MFKVKKKFLVHLNMSIRKCTKGYAALKQMLFVKKPY